MEGTGGYRILPMTGLAQERGALRPLKGGMMDAMKYIPGCSNFSTKGDKKRPRMPFFPFGR